MEFTDIEIGKKVEIRLRHAWTDTGPALEIGKSYEIQQRGTTRVWMRVESIKRESRTLTVVNGTIVMPPDAS